VLQSKCLRLVTGSPWYLSNRQIHEDLGVPLFADHDRALTASFDSRLPDVESPLVRQLGRYLLWPRGGGCSDLQGFWKFQKRRPLLTYSALGIHLVSSCDKRLKVATVYKTIEVLILHALALTSITQYPPGIEQEAL